jgi:hypothetical protein
MRSACTNFHRRSITWALLPGFFVFAACAHPRQAAPQVHLAGPAAVTTEPAHAPVPAPPVPQKVDFTTQIQPILARCQPCHFPGGKMYAALPFDRAETVVRLREKLFTRIKDEGERRTIREFLAQNPALPTPRVTDP